MKLRVGSFANQSHDWRDEKNNFHPPQTGRFTRSTSGDSLHQTTNPQKHMATETKGRNSARIVKIVSAIAMIVGMIGFMALAGDPSAGWKTNIFGAMCLGGFLGFVVGRFMD